MRHVIPVRTLTPQCERLQVGTSAEQHRRHVLVVHKGASFSDTTRPCRRLAGTLYGHPRGRVVLALQETSCCLPSLVVELALQMHALLRELGNVTRPAHASSLRRSAARRRPRTPRAARAGSGARGARAPPLLDEPAWTMFCYGKKTGENDRML